MRERIIVVDQHRARRDAIVGLLKGCGPRFELIALATLPAAGGTGMGPVDACVVGADRESVAAAVAEARAAFGETPVLVIGGDGPRMAVAALTAGANASLSQPSGPAAIAQALDAVLLGATVVCGPPSHELASYFDSLTAEPRPAQTDLTAREHEVMETLSRGATTREIAQTLGVSRRTIERHLYNAYRKLGVNERSDAVRTFRALAGAAARERGAEGRAQLPRRAHVGVDLVTRRRAG